MSGIESIASERQRQIDEEGWTPEHDDMHDAGELAEAAACYAACANTYFPDPPAEWPFDDSWWKQSTARRDLVKAGALIAAEIDRLDREAERLAARTSSAPRTCGTCAHWNGEPTLPRPGMCARAPGRQRYCTVKRLDTARQVRTDTDSCDRWTERTPA